MDTLRKRIAGVSSDSSCHGKARSKRRITKLQYRGNWQDLAQSSKARSCISRNRNTHGEKVSRLKLAEWLVDPKNPLTARVLVNRLWEQVFGIGIVLASEEFGSRVEYESS